MCSNVFITGILPHKNRVYCLTMSCLKKSKRGLVVMKQFKQLWKVKESDLKPCFKLREKTLKEARNETTR